MPLKKCSRKNALKGHKHNFLSCKSGVSWSHPKKEIFTKNLNSKSLINRQTLLLLFGGGAIFISSTVIIEKWPMHRSSSRLDRGAN
jgi:hypothetical protein